MKIISKGKIIAFVVGFIAAFLLTSALMLDASFSLGRVYYGSFVFENEIIEDEKEFVECVKASYNISEKKAEQIFTERDEYVNVVLHLKIENNSLLPMYIINSVSSNNSGVYVCKDTPESQSLCYIKPGEDSYIATDVILRKSELTSSLFESLKINVFAIGIPPIFNAHFSEIEQLNTIAGVDEAVNPDFPESFDHEKLYYQPIENASAKYNINDFNDYTYNYPRFYDGGVYDVVKYTYNKMLFCGFVFFDENGKFERGMAINELFEDKSDFNFKIGKDTLKNVEKLDSGCFRFECTDGTSKTYHYFRDKTCLEITYTEKGVISAINDISVAGMFDKLTEDDLAYIFGL